MIGLRASPELRKAVETWAAGEHDQPTLSEAIRHLVELGLSIAPQRTTPAKTKAKAAALAGDAIDQMGDTRATNEERAGRKPRRLVKGPEEFRNMRGDRAKSKGRINPR
jgi:hypothetical protein